jgi:hypothetical protein
MALMVGINKEETGKSLVENEPLSNSIVYFEERCQDIDSRCVDQALELWNALRSIDEELKHRAGHGKSVSNEELDFIRFLRKKCEILYYIE